jgi:hypothetical protein
MLEGALHPPLVILREVAGSLPYPPHHLSLDPATSRRMTNYDSSYDSAQDYQ